MTKTFRKNSKTQKIYQDKDRRHQKVSRSCLHHGGCPYCESNRLHNKNKNELESKLQVKEFYGSTKL